MMMLEGYACGYCQCGDRCFAYIIHFMICHSKKCHRPRTSSCHKEQRGETNALLMEILKGNDCAQGFIRLIGFTRLSWLHGYIYAHTICGIH